MNKAPMRTLMSSNEECLNLNSTIFVAFKNLTNNHIPPYLPEGWNKLFHISYFFIPLIGFLTTIFVAIFISLITGGNKAKNINPILFNGLVRKFTQKNSNQKISGKVELGNVNYGS
ncbi:sodium-coupled monocarboxylate transporter 1-like protein 2 [Leptotrombidium deliense]|uniref:Sodium-coupled monocarboxylate transporter 1-like protein 2 n=1 Tax=Leptotrombidium deliense TaxID=299467 RepID=A0A443S1U4_9ACAR|nr:sodium-coupled monocarboxylate transporter 1-like protein 2 [Leptotrombidium deliense]